MHRRSRHAHRTRNIARVVLFAWLFAVMASLANACVLSGDERSQGLEYPHSTGVDSHARQLSHAGEHHGSSPAEEACKGFCDLEQSAVLKAPSSGALDLATPPLSKIDIWSTLPTPASVRVALAAYGEPPPGPPVAIRFLRLTI